IRQLIETQLKGSRPGATATPALPALRDARKQYHSDALYGVFGPDQSASAPSGQLTYGGRDAQRTVAMPGPRNRKLLYAVGAAALVAAVLGVVALTRTGGSGGAPAETAKPLAGAAASGVPTPPATVKPAVPVVRGVTDDTITVGMSAAFSGSSRELGNRMKLGLETAFASINDAGGVAGRTIKLLALDDGYEGKRALANAQELISDRSVFVIIG